MAAQTLFSQDLAERIRLALWEDLGEEGDITSDAIFPPNHESMAHIEAKSPGVLCGIEVVRIVFEQMDPKIQLDAHRRDGGRIERGDVVLVLQGPTRSLLSAERLALNLLQRLSGIATLTAQFVEASGGKVAICDTRKTTPLWRDVEKYAVKCGGGVNHRFGLFDMVMLKDTHEDGSGGMPEALERVRKLRPKFRVAAEARTIAEVQSALEIGVDLLMLDNMDVETLREAIKLARGRVELEITGGVSLETIRTLADLGVDRVSIGALTHSAPALDFSMKIDL